MTIKRLINGQKIEIELTHLEVAEAYREMSYDFDVEEMLDELAEYDEDKFAEYGLTLDDLREEVDTATGYMQNVWDGNDYVWEARWDARNAGWKYVAEMLSKQK